MKKLIWIAVIGIVCLAGCTLSGLNLGVDNATTDSVEDTKEVPVK